MTWVLSLLTNRAGKHDAETWNHPMTLLAQTALPMGRHHRPDEDEAQAAARYEQLVRLLYQHRAAQHSGLCLVCGMGWPCRDIWLVLGVRESKGPGDTAGC